MDYLLWGCIFVEGKFISIIWQGKYENAALFLQKIKQSKSLTY